MIVIPNIGSTVDVQAECTRLFKVAKRNLEKSGQLVPMAFIVKADGTIDAMTRDVSSWNAKRLDRTLITHAAKRTSAAAVILINDAWVKHGSLNELSNYRFGDVARSSDKRECLTLILFGSFGTYFMQSFYHRAHGGDIIVWDEELALKKADVAVTDLLEPWWDEKTC